MCRHICIYIYIYCIYIVLPAEELDGLVKVPELLVELYA